MFTPPFIALLALVIFLFVLLCWIFFRAKKQREEAQNYQRTFFGSVIQILEFDRQRISKDLHDEIGTTLSIIKMNLTKMMKHPENGDQNQQLLEASGFMLENVIRSTREISQELMSPTLMKLGYERGMVELGKKLGIAGAIEINVDVKGSEFRLPQLMELEAYRIMQEVLNNVIRHAEATKIGIEIISDEKSVITNVSHNGNGLDMPAMEKLRDLGKGVGLKSIQKRLELIDAEIEYKGNAESGPKIIIRIPRHENN
ncbi:MAG: sensor histidine kinase [Bacteroidia bacterium]